MSFVGGAATAGPPPGPLGRFPTGEREASLDWLLAACRSWLASGGDEEAPPAETSPAPLARMAYCHNLEPLLHLLGTDGVVTAPAPELAERWQRAYFESVAFDQALLDRLDELLRECRREGLPVVVLKGLASSAAWGGSGLRQASDVDLLCRERDLVALCRAAGRLGYRAGGLDAVYHLKIQHSELAIPVEIHFDLYDLIANRREFQRRAIDGRVELELDGFLLPALAPEPAAVLTLAHLLNHDFQVGLRQLLDLAVLLHRTPTLDRELLWRELDVADLKAEMEIAEALLADLFHVPEEAAGDEPVSAKATANALGDTLRQRFLESEPDFDHSPLAEATSRSWRQRPYYLLRLLIPPPRRLEALRSLTPGVRKQGYAAHVGDTLRRGWTKISSRRRGARSPGSLSLKRRLYARRTRPRVLDRR